MNALAWYVPLLLLCNYRIPAADGVQRFFSKHTHFRSVGHTLEATSVLSSTHCAKICVKHANCSEYNVGPVDEDNANRRQCEILQTDESSTMNLQTGWNLYSGKYYSHSLMRIIGFAKGIELPI